MQNYNDNVVKSIGNKIRKVMVKETLEWKQAIAEHQEKQKKIAKLQEEKRIGFKF